MGLQASRHAIQTHAPPEGTRISGNLAHHARGHQLLSDSELRAAVDAQRVTGDPASLVGGEKYDSGAYIVRLGDTFQCLDAQREVATGIAPCEVGHVGVDHTWRDGVDADAAAAQGRSEMLHERIDGTLGGRIGGQRADSRMRR
jgi:hypothetical protein